MEEKNTLGKPLTVDDPELFARVWRRVMPDEELSPIALGPAPGPGTEEPDRAAERLSRALELSDTIGSPRWKGITIYLTWKIRKLMKGNRCPALEALWPEGEEEHCVWCLSYLRRLQPRMETAEMERELLRVREEPHQN